MRVNIPGQVFLSEAEGHQGQLIRFSLLNMSSIKTEIYLQFVIIIIIIIIIITIIIVVVIVLSVVVLVVVII